jgi:hypothetical protein
MNDNDNNDDDHGDLLYGVPLLDKIYTLKAEPLDGTLTGCALLQFADQELAKISHAQAPLYFDNPATGYHIPTGSATKERAKLRVARAALENERKKNLLKNRKKSRLIDSKQRQQDAYQKSISKRYDSLMRNQLGGTAAEANRLMKAIESSGTSSTKSAHSRHSNHRREPAGAGMTVMKNDGTRRHDQIEFQISANPTKPLLQLYYNVQKKQRQLSIRKSSTQTTNRARSTSRSPQKSPKSTGIIDSKSDKLGPDQDETLSKTKTKTKTNTKTIKVKKIISHRKFANQKIPKRPPQRKRTMSRENQRLMREIQLNLEREDDIIPMEIDIGFAYGLQPKAERHSLQWKERHRQTTVELTHDNNDKHSQFISLNINRALAATEASTRIDQSREAVSSRYYGMTSHTSSYPSVFTCE